MRSSRPSLNHTLLAAALLALPGCSIHQLAVDRLGDALAKTGTTFTADDDPELVGQALPFGLKLMESILAESPSHRGLLLATGPNLWVAQPADELRELDFEAADREYERARRLYLRARDYGLRGLEVRYPGIGAQLQQDPLSCPAEREAGGCPVSRLDCRAVGSGDLALGRPAGDDRPVADRGGALLSRVRAGSLVRLRDQWTEVLEAYGQERLQEFPGGY